MKVALVYNLKRAKDKDTPSDYFSEFDSQETVKAIASALRRGAHEVFLAEANTDILDWLRANPVDIVFNIAEGFSGASREAQIPAILDFLNIPYTGSGALAQSLSLDKAMAKQIFLQNGIPTPRFQLFKTVNQPLRKDLTYPLIVKPNCEGSAKGIHAASKVDNAISLYAEIARVQNSYHQDALVEEFIEGRELTVGILGNENPRVLPILEIDFTNCQKQGQGFYSWEVKEYQGIDLRYPDPEFFCPARISPFDQEHLEALAQKAHLALGCLDVSRVDFRLSSDHIPYILELNSLPGLDPLESNLTKMAQAANLSYPDLVNAILESALIRHGLINVQSSK